MYYALHGMRGTSHGIPHYMHCASIATPWHFASDALYFPWYLMGRPIGLPLGWVVLPWDFLPGLMRRGNPCQNAHEMRFTSRGTSHSNYLLYHSMKGQHRSPMAVS